MFQPELYSRYNQMPHIEAKWVLKNYLHLLNMKDDGSGKILEIGCGPADITENILLPALPQTFEKFVSSDISEEMIKFAKLKSKDARISYKVLDITNTDGLKEFGTYNHIFSFLVLQLVTEQKKAVKSMNKLLALGGNMLLTQLIYVPFFDIYEYIFKKGLWHDYTYDYLNFASFFKSEDPKNDFKIYLEEEGFTINFIEVFDKSYEYPDLDSFRGFMLSVNPFLKRIPKSLHDNYIADFTSAAENLGYIGNKIVYHFGLMVAVATKES